MTEQVFGPNPAYASKLRLNVTLVAFLIGVVSILFAWLVSLDEGERAGVIIATVFLMVDGVWWLVAMALTGPYFRSLRYEIHDDEVIVRVGIFVKSVKHVPFRTVTNVTVKRDIFDRWFFGLGSLNIQTAGMSGTKGAEERLVGLPNVQEIYEIVAKALRRFRGGMTPTQAEADHEESSVDDAVLRDILAEIRAIRRAKEG